MEGDNAGSHLTSPGIKRRNGGRSSLKCQTKAQFLRTSYIRHFSLLLYEGIPLCHLAWHIRMPSAQPAVDKPSLAVYIATLITSEEQRHSSDLIRVTATLQRVDVPDLALPSTCSCGVIYGGCHSRLNQARADGVDPNVGSSELIGNRLSD